MNKQINKGMSPNIYCWAMLVLLSEEIKLLFKTATNLSDRFFRVYVSFNDAEKLLTYNGFSTNLDDFILNDAIKTLLIDGQTIDVGSVILGKNRIAGPYRISNDKKNNTEYYQVYIAYDEKEWRSPRVPKELLDELTKGFKSNVDSINTNEINSLVIREIINRSFNPTNIVRTVCEKEIIKYFGKNDFREGELFDCICNLACKPYEGQLNKGSIRFASDDYKKDYSIKFVNPVKLTKGHVREIRKLLEMTDQDLSLLIKDQRAVGLGKENVSKYNIRFEGNGIWKLYPNEKDGAVFTVEGGICTFASSDNEDEASLIFKNLFKKENIYTDSIGKIVESAKKQKHGTAIIICNHAQTESERLSKMGRAIAIEPVSLIDDERAVYKLTSIDGALIISPEGVCFSIGAILDGEAVVEGDRARGARYNSIYNYIEWKKHKEEDNQVMGVIISEDQIVDYLPKWNGSKEESARR